MIIKFYIAGKFELRGQFRELAKALEFENSSLRRHCDWLDQPAGKVDDKVRRMLAIRDYQQIEQTDLFIFVSDPPILPDDPNADIHAGSQSCGRHVEFGIALGIPVNILALGKPNNVFHWHPNVDYRYTEEIWWEVDGIWCIKSDVIKAVMSAVADLWGEEDD